MNPIDRVWLLIKMLKENYDNELSRLQRISMGPRPRPLTPEEKQECQVGAKKAVCETGISMYKFSKFLKSRYRKTIETEAVHHAVELGIRNGLLSWSNPRRYDMEKGAVGQNIVLTEKGFDAIFQKWTEIHLAMINSLYMPRLGR